MESRGPDEGEPRPQLQIWDEGREATVGGLADGEGEWRVTVLVESVDADLFRGRFRFRRDDERYETAPILVEESTAAVVRRARELPTAMLRQLLASARG